MARVSFGPGFGNNCSLARVSRGLSHWDLGILGTIALWPGFRAVFEGVLQLHNITPNAFNLCGTITGYTSYLIQPDLW